MSKYGKYECFTKKYRRFKADNKREQKAKDKRKGDERGELGKTEC